jgi:hypothetical protein
MVKRYVLFAAIGLLLTGCLRHRIKISQAEGICTAADEDRMLLQYNYGAMEYKP